MTPSIGGFSSMPRMKMRHDARRVGLQRQAGELEQHAGPADAVAAIRERAGKVLGRRRFADLRLGAIHPGLVGDELLFHVADGLGVVGDLLLIVLAHRLVQLGEPFLHAVEHALAAFEPGEFLVHVALLPARNIRAKICDGPAQRRDAGPGRRVRQRAAVLRARASSAESAWPRRRAGPRRSRATPCCGSRAASGAWRW